MEDAKLMLPRANNNNKNTKEHQGGLGKEVGKQCEEYRKGPVRNIVHPTVNHSCMTTLYLHHCYILLEDRNTSMLQLPTKLKI